MYIICKFLNINASLLPSCYWILNKHFSAVKYKLDTNTKTQLRMLTKTRRRRK